MPRGRGRSKVRDKWRDKAWISVEAPKSFGSGQIAYIPVTSEQKGIGRVVQTTLFDLVKGDPQQFSVKLYFRIESIHEGKANTILKGHEYSREYLRSLIRRGSSTVSLIKDYSTVDGFRTRIYFIAFVQGRINSSRKHAIRLIADRILGEKSGSLTYDELAQEIVLDKIASDIYNEAKRISKLRKVGIRKTKLLKKSEAREESTPETSKEELEITA